MFASPQQIQMQRWLICCLTDLKKVEKKRLEMDKCLRIILSSEQYSLYEEQPNRVGLLSQERRQLTKYILEVYKIMILSQNGIEYLTVAPRLFVQKVRAIR